MKGEKSGNLEDQVQKILINCPRKKMNHAHIYEFNRKHKENKWRREKSQEMARKKLIWWRMRDRKWNIWKSSYGSN